MAAPLDLLSMSWDAIQAQNAAMEGRDSCFEECFGICCYSTQFGSGKHPLSPAFEEQPALCPFLSPDTEAFVFRRLIRPKKSRWAKIFMQSPGGVKT
jgi:hypothetical protein